RRQRLRRGGSRLPPTYGKAGAPRRTGPMKGGRSWCGEPGAAELLERGARGRVVRREPQGGLELGGGFVRAFLQEQRETEIGVRFRVRRERERPFERGDGVLRFAREEQGVAEIVQRADVIGLQPDGRAQCGDRIVIAPGAGEGITEAE